MTELPLFDEEYWDAFLNLLDEIHTVMSCSDNKEPWFPKDGERLELSLRVYGRWHPEEERR
ncbi:MAG: hypothetical protein A2Y79_11165 [Deltaproteobacteria bacterium RBG_13_43_22]|jgi:hypothetical protein|nr:MAG: hypothetical protein A2Y79_11165 [Deltaproteobacteria bacterium RBG_13_43_22]